MTVRATIRGLSAVLSRFEARAYIPLFLICVGLFVYYNSFSGAFVFDDLPVIVNNLDIRRLWPPWDFLVHAQARPLWELSLAVNYRLGGLNVWGYHAVNVAIHILAGLVLFGVVRRTLEGERLRDRYGRAAYGLAAAVAAIWLVHPLQTESVTYICQRAESLMGLLFLLTLYCSIRGSESSRPWVWYGAGITASALGMATKEVMVAAPLVVLLYDRVFLARSSKEIVQQRWGFYLGLAITWAVLGLELARIGSETVANVAKVGSDSESAVTSWEYLRSQPGVIVHYLRLCFWPHPLVLDYRWPVARTTLSVLPWAAIVLALAAGTALAFRRLPSLGFLGAWFFLILGPTSSILPISDLAFEHRMYLPLAAVVVIGVLLTYEGLRLFQSQRRTDRLQQWSGWGLLVIVVGGFGWTTVRRNADYRSAVAIWSDVVAKKPENPRAHSELGNQLAARGLFSDAIAHYDEALRLNPRYAQGHYNLGNALAGLGRLDEAMAHYAEALRLKPQFVDAHNNLGKALASRGRFDEAVAQYAEALRLNPKFGLAHYNLANALDSQGKTDEAGAHYLEAQRLNPQLVELQTSNGNALASQGKLEEAIDQYSVALRMSPNDVQVHRNLGIVLVQQGKLDEGIAHLKEALRLAPIAQAHYNLGNALALAGNTEGALEQMHAALKLDPTYELARRALDRLAASGK
jgi:tetratricopeptide (TPR) repeat protein